MLAGSLFITNSLLAEEPVEETKDNSEDPRRKRDRDACGG